MFTQPKRSFLPEKPIDYAGYKIYCTFVYFDCISYCFFFQNNEIKHYDTNTKTIK